MRSWKSDVIISLSDTRLCSIISFHFPPSSFSLLYYFIILTMWLSSIQFYSEFFNSSSDEISFRVTGLAPYLFFFVKNSDNNHRERRSKVKKSDIVLIRALYLTD